MTTTTTTTITIIATIATMTRPTTTRALNPSPSHFAVGGGEAGCSGGDGEGEFGGAAVEPRLYAPATARRKGQAGRRVEEASHRNGGAARRLRQTVLVSGE